MLNHRQQTTRARSNRNKFRGSSNRPQRGLLIARHRIALPMSPAEALAEAGHSPLAFSNRHSPRIKLQAKPYSLNYINFSNRRKFAISGSALLAAPPAVSSASKTRRSLGEGRTVNYQLSTVNSKAHLPSECYNHPLHPQASNLAGPKAAAGKRKIA